jgi:hypothetical protein
MKKDKVQELDHGLYTIYWKQSVGGGKSLAAVGSLANGDMWYACTNFISPKKSIDWKFVKKVKLIRS